MMARKNEVAFTALLVTIISGLEISCGTPFRDVISPSHNYRGQGRPPNLPVEINYRTSLDALATESRLRVQTGSSALAVQRQQPNCKWTMCGGQLSCLTAGLPQGQRGPRHPSPGQVWPEAGIRVSLRLRLELLLLSMPPNSTLTFLYRPVDNFSSYQPASKFNVFHKLFAN